MKLLTKEIEKKLPSMYSTEDVSLQNKKLIAKFFCPWNHWTWFAVEYDPKNKIFFGYVSGDFDEWGYFSLDELQKLRGSFGLKVERDMYFRETIFSDLPSTYKGAR